MRLWRRRALYVSPRIQESQATSVDLRELVCEMSTAPLCLRWRIRLRVTTKSLVPHSAIDELAFPYNGPASAPNKVRKVAVTLRANVTPHPPRASPRIILARTIWTEFHPVVLARMVLGSQPAELPRTLLRSTDSKDMPGSLT